LLPAVEVFTVHVGRFARDMSSPTFCDPGHNAAVVTSTLTRIESSGALVRAARSARADPADALARLDQDFTDGVITLVSADPADVERNALHVVRTHGIRALDAIHIATAQLVLPELAGPGDTGVFLSRDKEQSDAAQRVGLTVA
jgi:uncharacterized protein